MAFGGDRNAGERPVTEAGPCNAMNFNDSANRGRARERHDAGAARASRLSATRTSATARCRPGPQAAAAPPGAVSTPSITTARSTPQPSGRLRQGRRGRSSTPLPATAWPTCGTRPTGPSSPRRCAGRCAAPAPSPIAPARRRSAVTVAAVPQTYKRTFDR